jgi:hypothetical protein
MNLYRVTTELDGDSAVQGQHESSRLVRAKDPDHAGRIAVEVWVEEHYPSARPPTSTP